jgi:predicted DNA-binding protein
MGKYPGRPRVDEPATARVTFRCTTAQRVELRRIADETGRGVSTIVKEAVDEWVGDYRDGRVFRQTKT